VKPSIALARLAVIPFNDLIILGNDTWLVARIMHMVGHDDKSMKSIMFQDLGVMLERLNHHVRQNGLAKVERAIAGFVK